MSLAACTCYQMDGKVLADVVEALIGVWFYHLGPQIGLLFLQHIGMVPGLAMDTPEWLATPLPIPDYFDAPQMSAPETWPAPADVAAAVAASEAVAAEKQRQRQLQLAAQLAERERRAAERAVRAAGGVVRGRAALCWDAVQCDFDLKQDLHVQRVWLGRMAMQQRQQMVQQRMAHWQQGQVQQVQQGGDGRRLLQSGSSSAAVAVGGDEGASANGVVGAVADGCVGDGGAATARANGDIGANGRAAAVAIVGGDKPEVADGGNGDGAGSAADGSDCNAWLLGQGNSSTAAVISVHSRVHGNRWLAQKAIDSFAASSSTSARLLDEAAYAAPKPQEDGPSNVVSAAAAPQLLPSKALNRAKAQLQPAPALPAERPMLGAALEGRQPHEVELILRYAFHNRLVVSAGHVFTWEL